MTSTLGIVALMLLAYGLIGRFEADDWVRPALWLSIGGIDLFRAGWLLGNGELYGWWALILGVAWLVLGGVRMRLVGMAVKR